VAEAMHLLHPVTHITSVGDRSLLRAHDPRYGPSAISGEREATSGTAGTARNTLTRPATSISPRSILGRPHQRHPHLAGPPAGLLLRLVWSWQSGCAQHRLARSRSRHEPQRRVRNDQTPAAPGVTGGRGAPPDPDLVDESASAYHISGRRWSGSHRIMPFRGPRQPE
jgi:hypothetical protein